MTDPNPDCAWCYGTGLYEYSPGACGDPDCCGSNYEVECVHCWDGHEQENVRKDFTSEDWT